ncbi:MAG TPA: preprotein translocase subunit SecA [Elusimicrobia bacterium]|nr:preprotein translocase subunit SecA [Elusimicrobiota bacterium]
MRGLKSFFGDRCLGLAEAADALRADAEGLSDDRLREGVQAFRAGRAPLGKSSDPLVELFVLIREAAHRAVGQRPYLVQMMAGFALAEGHFAEMATGEGKTLATIFPAAVRALEGGGVHVCTVNAYLAQRDHRLMEPVYRMLGLTSGLLPDGWDRESKRQAYACDITYGTGYEFGFDYLRDQLALVELGLPRLGEALRGRLLGEPERQALPCQRGRAAVVIDEADSVLADEALMPLILTRAGDRPHPHPEVFRAALSLAGRLAPEDYLVEPDAHQVELTKAGLDKAYALEPAPDPQALARPWHAYVELALHAGLLLRRDVHYVVKDGRIWLVDQNIGRLFKDRKWRDGLHQSVEAKEGLAVTEESSAAVSISRQGFFRLYGHLSGMSGTLAENRRELKAFYGRKVVVIPLNRPCRRTLLPDRVFKTAAAKLEALLEDVLRRRQAGQPVLIGTKSIASSERIAGALRLRGAAPALLNAKQDDEEAAIVARAGQRGALTIATNMAGRGTDIPLGSGAAEAGGLHVVGAERQESRRLDRQLAGRGARQGDPGSAQFFLCAEDEVVARFKPELKRRWLGLPSDERGELDPRCAAEVERLQEELEKRFALMRQDAAVRERWLDRMRKSL